MQVSAILKRKGGAVITAAPDETGRVIAEMLADHRIGAVVLTTADGSVAGIVSERDIVHGIARRGPGVLDLPVSALMTREVVTCTPAQSIVEVMQVMTDRRIRHLPVVEHGRLAGLVSIGDVVKERVEEAEQDVEMLQGYISGSR